MTRGSAMNVYNKTCFECSKTITHQYSTSFSIGIRAFDKRFRYPIYAVYGFVRAADEIVDTFHNHDKLRLITDFRRQTFEAIEQRISINPVLHSFQEVVNHYHIENKHIEAFLNSMEVDLESVSHTSESYRQYIYGSAEVVGLMCLRVFCENNESLYQKLMPSAQSLGAAFQKVNFLRDMKSDFEERGRVYFPELIYDNFTEDHKREIEADIQRDFDQALEGVKQLPHGTKLGVYIAYIYYLQLFKKISGTPANVIMQSRIRVSDRHKMALYLKAVVQQKLKVV